MFKSIGKELYPEALRQIAWVPERLYYEGEINLINNLKNIAVVGTRRMSEYGREVTAKFSKELVQDGWVIVSGLARGVDRVAHETCLKYGGKTIAVLAHGLDMTYPSEHAELRRQIVARGGLIVSEHKEGVPLTKQNLAVRNRIVVGISACVLVTESPKSSGTKITVKFAANAGIDVYVIPGPIKTRHTREHRANEDGCIPVYLVKDIMYP
jgi:DNA processing protein